MKYILGVLIAIVLLSSSCEKDDNKSPLNELKNFEILELDVPFQISDNVVSGFVSAGTILTDRTIVFEISEKASLLIDGTEQVSGVSKHDFTDEVEVVVVAENGAKKPYTIIVGKMANEEPVSYAGNDTVIYVEEGVTNKEVVLDGSGSIDEDGEIVSYRWEEEGAQILTGMSGEVNLPLGKHTITLKVEDNLGATHESQLTIYVREIQAYTPLDLDASTATQNLLLNLGKIANGPEFAFGQEFPMSFKLNSLRWSLETSDSKEVTGDHPAVYGIDPHYMLYKSEDQKQLHIDEALYAYQNGGIITFDFHQQSRYNHKIYMDDITDDRDKSLMYDIVNDNDGARDWFFEELDQVIAMINNDLGFPVVFRLYHEMNGGWFWWGSKATNHSKQLYIDFFRLAVDYIRDRSNLVLFAWSPNVPFDTDYYPGNNYVDIVGVDYYEPSASQLTSVLKQVSSFAAENKKIAVLSETGQRDNYINNYPDFWTSTILKGIKDGADEIKIAWVLGWFNAPWTSSQSDLFIPNAESPASARNDFVEFYQDGTTLFLQETHEMQLYETP
ncbi:glycosyl hydrolase [Marinilabilia rubra]|nr:glycosyl hydrolase [Marinilabilia rubra]